MALLLLSERDNFEPLEVDEGNFYKIYKNIIDEKIDKVCKDFNITDEKITEYIKAEEILPDSDNFEQDKIWFVFADGFGTMHEEMMYRPNLTPFQMYCCLENKSKSYSMMESSLEGYQTGCKIKYK